MNGKNILLTTVTLISLVAQSLNAQDLTQKEKSINLLEKAFSTKQDRSVLNYINDKKYIQHNLYAKDGIDGLKGYLDYLNGKELKNDVVIAFEDNNYVVTLSSTSQEKQLSKVIDIFRFEKGLIVEHWDNAQELAKDEKLQAVEVIDIDKTQKNKQLIKEIIDEKVFAGNYLKNHMILAQGNLVLSVSEVIKENQKIALYELFDIKNSKIINHWTIEEFIPSINEWKNSNGKF